MRCPVCVDGGLTSRVEASWGATLDVIRPEPYWDEAGDYHHHETFASLYTCSRGHEFRPAHKGCPSCDEGTAPAWDSRLTAGSEA
jgi:hypothetical protein